MVQGLGVYYYKVAYLVRKQLLYSSQNIRILLNNRELVNDYLISTLGNNLSLAYDFQRYKQETTQVKLVLQNKLN